MAAEVQEEIVMTLRGWFKAATVLIAIVTGVSVYFAWRGAQREQAQLKAELQAAQQAMALARSHSGC